MLLAVGMLAGAFYWNDQMAFGVELPKFFPHCTGVSDAPDRGVYIFFKKNGRCPDLNIESLFEYSERNRIPTISLVAWYNTVEEFGSSQELVQAYCPKSIRIFNKKTHYGNLYYCFVSKGKRTSLLGFVQLHQRSLRDEVINVEFKLNDVKKSYAAEYWRLVVSLVLSRPSTSLIKRE